MSHRLQIIEELKIDFEVPYVTARGEAIDCMVVPINERKHGLYFSYDLLKQTERNLDVLFPPEGIELLGRTTKEILREMGIAPARVILQLHECSPDAKSGSLEGRAPVNRDRDTVLIIITKTPFVYKFGSGIRRCMPKTAGNAVSPQRIPWFMSAIGWILCGTSLLTEDCRIWASSTTQGKSEWRKLSGPSDIWLRAKTYGDWSSGSAINSGAMRSPCHSCCR